MKLSELHDCVKSHNKIVAIAVNKVGITKCNYCGEIVDYISWFREMVKTKCLNCNHLTTEHIYTYGTNQNEGWKCNIESCKCEEYIENDKN